MTDLTFIFYEIAHGRIFIPMQKHRRRFPPILFRHANAQTDIALVVEPQGPRTLVFMVRGMRSLCKPRPHHTHQAIRYVHKVQEDSSPWPDLDQIRHNAKLGEGFVGIKIDIV